jgi:hypothetical protein
MTFLKCTGEGPVFELYDNFQRSHGNEDDVWIKDRESSWSYVVI